MAERRPADSPDPLPSPAAVARLGKVEVQELDGSWTELGSTWAERPAAVVWIRHYG